MQKLSIIISILAILGLVGYISYDQFLSKKYPFSNSLPSPTLLPTQLPTINPAPQPTETPVPAQSTGTVEGSISYPGEGIPTNLEVCAESLSGVQFKCTNTQIKDSKYNYGVGYKLDLPPGKYYIYSQVPSQRTGYKAYYNEFVTCGLSVNCTSHNKIEVEVEAGKTLDEIDPQDWYNQ